MSRTACRLIGALMVGAGVLLLLFGLWAMGAYVVGVIEVLDAPDQSWMFWGLAILFLGIMAAGAGAGLIVAGRTLRRNTG